MEHALLSSPPTTYLARERAELEHIVSQWAGQEASGLVRQQLSAAGSGLLSLLLDLTSRTISTNLQAYHVRELLGGARALRGGQVQATADDWQHQAATQLWSGTWTLGAAQGLRPGRVLVGIVQQADALVQLQELEQLLAMIGAQCGVEESVIALGWGYTDAPGTGVRVLLLAGLQ
ncbi:hypothetical protein [Hymenobacter sp. 102]|uniref:hypothetical protein n=1 Tax=Hymenobacter sp. 102 TaxID=3403152 RepID=UPI003CFAA95A